MSYNAVAYAEGLNGEPYVLKLGPASEELTREIAALKFYDGQGIAKLIQADETVGALLLERLEPGLSIRRGYDDETATYIAAQLLLELWRPAAKSQAFRQLSTWLRALRNYPQQYGNNGPLNHAMVRQANGLLDELLKENSEAVLLHADLHHDNILSANHRAYLAIDPKGIVGPRGYDVGPFLMNPTPEISKRPNLKRVLAKRIDIFSEILGLSHQELSAWGIVHAVTSACWRLEDHGDGYQAAQFCATELSKL